MPRFSHYGQGLAPADFHADAVRLGRVDGTKWKEQSLYHGLYVRSMYE